MKAVAGGKNGKLALDAVGRDVVDSGPRIIHQSTKNRKIIDTEDKQESQERQSDGKLITETRRTVQREEVSKLALELGISQTSFKSRSNGSWRWPYL